MYRHQQFNKTRAEELEDRRNLPPEVTSNMARQVSGYRREMLEDEVNAGDFREQGSSPLSRMVNMSASTLKIIHEPTSLGSSSYTSQDQIIKSAQTSAALSGQGGVLGAGGVGFRGPGGTVKQVPEVYSPLWLNSNLNLPRDRATVNAWSRSFFALNPIVHNAISLHSTYPISKLNIKCKNRKVEQFFAEMCEEIDLMNVCVAIAQEFWVLGEAFVYGELDERTAKWSRLMIQNPDYITVKRSVVAGDPIISLRPDENLKRIVFSQRAVDIQQRRQLDPSIVEHVKRGENIPLNNFYVSHLARRISPYEVRGTGVIVNCFRQLMLFDKTYESKFAQADGMINPLTLVKVGNDEFRPTPIDLEQWREVFECYDEETEVLTDQGFKKFEDVIEYQTVMDGTYGIPQVVRGSAVAKPGYKIACFNPATDGLEYHEPSSAHVSDCNGDMLCASGKKLDICVTPNHRMWVSEKQNNKWKDFTITEASSLFDKKSLYKFKSTAKWKGGEPEYIEVLGVQVPIELYLKALGYIVSEGCVFSNRDSEGCASVIKVSQLTKSKHYSEMRTTLEKFAEVLDLNCPSVVAVKGEGYSKDTPKEKWECTISNKDLCAYFKENISINNKSTSHFKRLPRFVMDLSPRLLKILLGALVTGDGSENNNKDNTSSIGYSYSTVSKQLANDIYEIVFKAGYAPNLITGTYLKNDGRNVDELIVTWSTTNYGTEPNVRTFDINNSNNGSGPQLMRKHYDGKVWCFTVPTGLFVTRRNGKITIQGNSAQYDKDAKIFTHNAVEVERIGYGQGIYDVSGDITQLIKLIYVGLMVPSVVMDGSDTTYATGSVALDVLRQRYMQFRNMLANWLKEKIFAPISRLNDFYDYEDGEKKLIVPEVEWNHMSLFDMSDYIGHLMQLANSPEPGKNKVSVQTLYRSLGLEYEDELRKMRYEDIQEAIRMKELSSIGRMDLNKLRALNPDDEIEEVQEPPVPGEDPYDPVPGQPGGLGGPTGGLPGMPPPLPMPGGPPSSPIGGGGLKPPSSGPPPPAGNSGIAPGGAPKPPPPG